MIDFSGDRDCMLERDDFETSSRSFFLGMISGQAFHVVPRENR
jgi:hypothetical protein